MGLGINCLAKVGPAGATPTTPVPGISDFQVTPQFDKTEVITRGSKVKRGLLTVLGITFSGKVLIDADAGYAAMHTGFNSGAPVCMLILDGPATSSQTTGYQLDVNIEKWAEDQGPQAVLMRDFELSPALTSYAPTRADGGSGSVTLTDL